MSDQTSIVSDILAAVHFSDPAFAPGETGQYAVLPQGYSVRSLEEFQDAANRVVAAPVFTDVASLVAYCENFDWPPEAIYTASKSAFRISASLDYSDAETARHHSHTPSFVATPHPALLAWQGKLNHLMTQQTFAEFLEERAMDLVFPDAATIMELVLTFEATKSVSFRQSTRLADGSRQFSYSEENQAKGAITLPDHLLVAVPLFEGMDTQTIKFNLRYRIEDAKLRFTLVWPGKDDAYEVAFGACVDEFSAAAKAAGVSKPVLRVK